MRARAQEEIAIRTTSSTEASTEHGATGAARLRFARSREDALIAGVAGGFGARWGIDPFLVRIVVVVLGFAGGVGLFAYLALWAVSLETEHPQAPPPREPSERQALAFGLVGFGLVLVFRGLGLWFGDAVGIPLLIAAVGAAVISVHSDGRLLRGHGPPGAAARELPRPSLMRIITGGVLVITGVSVFLVAGEPLATIGPMLLAVLVTTAGLGIVFGPWVWRLVDQLAAERRERIRSEERAEMAAHLHDSVLQTLALIQRNAENPRRMLSLARRQERELRAWLYGEGPGSEAGRLKPAVEAMAQQVEEANEVRVEAVVVGDGALDDRTRAFVHALREAATNAVRHSDAEEVSVFVECEPGEVVAYVRDRGRGFDPDAVPPDRRGIADSIRGRIERHGGRVSISSAVGEGCEVHLRIPRRQG